MALSAEDAGRKNPGVQSGCALSRVCGLLSPLYLASHASPLRAQSRELGLPTCPLSHVDLCQRAWPILGHLLHFGPVPAFWHSPGKGNGLPLEAWVLFILRGLWVHCGCLWQGGGASFGLTGPLLFPQLGLLVDLSSDGLMIPEDGVNNEELEAEFLALVGGQPQALEKLKGKGKIQTILRTFPQLLQWAGFRARCWGDGERRQKRSLPSWNPQSGLKVK